MKHKILRCLILLAFLIGAGIALFKIHGIVSEYRAGEQVYDQMQEYVHVPETTAPAVETEPSSETEPTVPSTETTLPPVEYPEVDFEALLDINQDVVGWICIEDTKVNYPILQGYDNRHYVSSLIDGTYNNAGSIFMDFRNQPDFSDRHTIIYGHNLKNGAMFADITKYRNQDYYDAHPVGMIVTPEKQFRFEIVAGYVASLAESSWQLEFVNDADALQWLEAAMERSPFESRVKPEPGDRMITLSTCTYEFSDARFVLVGILMEE